MSNVVLSMKADIKKAIETIQCRNSFSLLQRKMYNVLLANAFSIEEVNSNTTYRISIGLLCKLMGYDSKDYKTIKEKFRELTSKNCFYCGDDPQKLHGRNDLNGGYVFNGIDRIDNKLGYIDGNVITCCSICNKMKLDTDYNIFLFRVKKIYLKLMHGGWE